MKAKKLIKNGLVLFISGTILITGCASNNNSNPPSTEETSTEDEKNPKEKNEKDTQKADTESGSQTTPEPTDNSKTDSPETPEPIDDSKTDSPEELQISGLFKEVYLPYATREKPFMFEAVKTFVQNLNSYTVEITEPTQEDMGSIKLTDENEDYVYFAFSPTDSGIEMIISLSYCQAATNSEVSLNNFSSDCSPEYDVFNTHIIGETELQVSNPDEQKAFLLQK
ncbi:hypothetical protein C806_00110 [Lachnospiraceae bacterium 3-1]|nr:hypothetical protein C806_00110 [Lachnospiraceae bacterium 3-1]